MRTLVKCDVVGCIYNSECLCHLEEIEIILIHDKEGICRIECSAYKSKIEYEDYVK